MSTKLMAVKRTNALMKAMLFVFVSTNMQVPIGEPLEIWVNGMPAGVNAGRHGFSACSGPRYPFQPAGKPVISSYF